MPLYEFLVVLAEPYAMAPSSAGPTRRVSSRQAPGPPATYTTRWDSPGPPGLHRHGGWILVRSGDELGQHLSELAEVPTPLLGVGHRVGHVGKRRAPGFAAAPHVAGDQAIALESFQVEAHCVGMQTGALGDLLHMAPRR